MKIVNGILAVLFVLFAVVQLNDPDPWLWVTYYLLIAVLEGMAVAKKFSQPLVYVGMAASVIFFFYYLDGVIELFTEHPAHELAYKMKADKPYIEHARESLGALIGLVALVFVWRQGRKATV